MTRLGITAGPVLTVAAIAAGDYRLWHISPLLCILWTSGVVVFAMTAGGPLLAALGGGLAFMAVTIAALFLGAWYLLLRLGRTKPARRIERAVFCGRPWLVVLNIAEKRARRKLKMPRYYPERMACIYRKAPWNELQAQLWPDRGWVREIESDMRERGWRLP